MAPDAGSPSFGGQKEGEGTKGYAVEGLEDAALRDGHNPEPDVPDAPARDDDTVADDDAVGTTGAGREVTVEHDDPAGTTAADEEEQ
jgi:hypothetical protein